MTARSWRRRPWSACSLLPPSTTDDHRPKISRDHAPIPDAPVTRRFTYRVVKRLVDVMLAGLGLAVLSPLFVFIGALIKLTSAGPIFYNWDVLGRGAKPFRGYKFRTMMANADALKPQLIHYNQMRGPVFKMANDPRVTPLGRLLRKYSLDELPQLWSVLQGDMSLVGPRPQVPRFVEKFDPGMRARYGQNAGYGR